MPFRQVMQAVVDAYMGAAGHSLNACIIGATIILATRRVFIGLCRLGIGRLHPA